MIYLLNLEKIINNLSSFKTVNIISIQQKFLIDFNKFMRSFRFLFDPSAINRRVTIA